MKLEAAYQISTNGICVQIPLAQCKVLVKSQDMCAVFRIKEVLSEWC